MQLREPEVVKSPKTSRRKPNLERIRKLRARSNADHSLWEKPYHELEPEEVAELKRQFFSGV